jgi:hypothetical protein
MSLKLSIKRCKDITHYYFGRSEGGLVGAVYCVARPVVRTEEDYCVAEPWAGYSWVGYSEEYGRLYVFSKPGEVSEVFRLSRGFRPLCMPSVRWGGGVSRWWGFGYAILKGDFGDAYIDVYGVVTENLEFVKMKTPDLFDKVERCRGMFEKGSGSLVGAELPVVRRPSGYLRVGSWLAWHRVLGLLDDGRWVRQRQEEGEDKRDVLQSPRRREVGFVGMTASTRLSSRLLSKSRWRSSARLGM